jgi:hypothetical protein|tara:strand:- start:476 stop:964 length:489 start_codon:yes stop_codon:yes gene_type:complete
MRVFLIYFFCICFNTLHAQTDIINSPILISSSGGTLTQNNYNLCFSLGEIAIETFIQSDVIITQGFHQDYYQVSTVDEISSQYFIDFFPNPTTDLLNVNCNVNQLVDLIIKDMKGSIVFSLLEVEGRETQQINLSHFSQGIYFLEIGLINNNKQVYKIQKVN